jgi:hypothetical protein
MPKGFTQWSEVNLNEGETFDRIADGMAGREKNYYGGSDKPSSTAPALPSATLVPGSKGNDTMVEDGPRDPGPDFHANKGRMGWQLVDVEDGHDNEPSSTSGHWHRISATGTGTPSASANLRSASSVVSAAPAPTLAPQDDSGTYAWNEDWGDWVSAGMDDMGMGMDAGWDDSTAYAPSQTGSSQPATSSTMSNKHSAGLS